MHSDLKQSARMLLNCVLITLFIAPSSPLAQTQTHVASPADIHKELVNSSRERQKNLEKVKQLFSSDAAQKALKSSRVDPAQVTEAVSTLSDAEIARLASRADRLQQDFAAGRLTERDLLIILVGLTALILIIVAVR